MVLRDNPGSLGAVPNQTAVVDTMLSGVLVPFWPYTRPDGIAVAVLIAMGVQLVSPWNEAASLYARYVRASAKPKGKVA